MTYKNDLYQSYVSTHIIGSKPTPTLELFRAQKKIWQSLFGRFLPQNKESNIADVGCGDGRITWWLQEIGFTNAEGVEISLEQVKVAAELGVRNIFQADLKIFLKTRTNYYDLLILRNIIEHFEKSEIIEVLGVCRDALKDGGRLIVQVPNAESPFFGRIRYGDFTHEIAFCARSLGQIFNLVGFTRHEYYSIEPIFSAKQSSLRRLLWKAVKSFYQLLLFAELGPGERIVTQDILAVAIKPKLV